MLSEAMLHVRGEMILTIMAMAASSCSAASLEERAQRCFAGATPSRMLSLPLIYHPPPKRAHLSGPHCGLEVDLAQRCATLKASWNRTFGGFSEEARAFVFPTGAGMSADALVKGMRALVESHASVNVETGRLPGFESFNWGHGARSRGIASLHVYFHQPLLSSFSQALISSSRAHLRFRHALRSHYD